jgi:hypothetical protein
MSVHVEMKLGKTYGRLIFRIGKRLTVAQRVCHVSTSGLVDLGLVFLNFLDWIRELVHGMMTLLGGSLWKF